MALLYAKSMIASFKHKTGKEYYEWCQLLMSRKFYNSEEVSEFLLKEGLSVEFIKFMLWTRHSHIEYTTDETKSKDK